MSIIQDNTEVSIYADGIPWKSNHEKILIEWADKAMCYRWLHSKSHQSYTNKYQWFTIPVIIMSTLTGTANFAQDRVPIEYRPFAQMAIGGINLFAGILTTISQFLKINELNESHRASSILWDRFYRSIKIELSKERKDRMPVTQFINKCQEQYDSLMETSPAISNVILTRFDQTFTSSAKDVIMEKKRQLYENFSSIKKPEICNELVTTSTFMAPIVEDKIIGNTPTLRLPVPDHNNNAENIQRNIVEQFINTFKRRKNRIPLRDEIINNIDDDVIQPDRLIEIIDKLEADGLLNIANISVNTSTDEDEIV